MQSTSDGRLPRSVCRSPLQSARVFRLAAAQHLQRSFIKRSVEGPLRFRLPAWLPVFDGFLSPLVRPCHQSLPHLPDDCLEGLTCDFGRAFLGRALCFSLKLQAQVVRWFVLSSAFAPTAERLENGECPCDHRFVQILQGCL